MLSDSEILSFLNTLEKLLLSEARRQKIVLSGDWTKQFPSAAGVYVVFSGDSVVYVGETGNLRGRMKDLLDSRHHVLRRTIGSSLFSGEMGYEEATSKKKFPSRFEKELDTWIEYRMRLSAIPVRLGRKELEERIVKEFDPIYNKKGQRQSS